MFDSLLWMLSLSQVSQYEYQCSQWYKHVIMMPTLEWMSAQDCIITTAITTITIIIITHFWPSGYTRLPGIVTAAATERRLNELRGHLTMRRMRRRTRMRRTRGRRSSRRTRRRTRRKIPKILIIFDSLPESQSCWREGVTWESEKRIICFHLLNLWRLRYWSPFPFDNWWYNPNLC